MSDVLAKLQLEIAEAQLAEQQWLEAGRITAIRRDEATQCRRCGRYGADCGCAKAVNRLVEQEQWTPEPMSGCWLWFGRTADHGYGRLAAAGREWAAHRISWLAFRGDIGPFSVCHRCDNPPCINPDHLFLGTQVDNNNDRHRKGRDARGERGHSAKLTEADVLEIRRRYAEAPKLGPAPRGGFYRRGISYNTLATEYGVSATTIYYIVIGRKWAHLPVVPGAHLCCGSDTLAHAWTCDSYPATCCGEEHCVCGGADDMEDGE